MLEISTKNNNLIVTAPVLIPGARDCDYNNGENPLTKEQIQKIEASFKDYAIIDRNHTYFFNLKSVGTPIKSWILDSPMTLKGVDGEVREYPTGTWMLTSSINDNITKNELQAGILTGYSVSAVPRTEANKFKAAITNSSFKSINRVNINDIDDPVAYTFETCLLWRNILN